MNTYQFYAKWLTDLAFDQRTDGAVPHVIPDIITGRTGTDRLLKQGTAAAAAWADAAVIIPWNLSLVFGSKDILIQQYESMKKWIHFMQTHSKNNIWNYQLQFGDWVALDAEEGSYFGATPNDLTCTAYYAYSTSLFVKIAHLLHKTADEKTYTQLYQNIVSTYVQTFFTEDGHMKVHTQTAHIISLYFHLVPQKYRSVVTADLVDLLEKEKNHLVTGFVGTPYFCHALSDNGRVDKAYDLLLQEDFPSWLYQVKKGATTIWEHWDGMKDDGSLWSADMNSFNHYAYGAIGEWMQQVMVGLQIDEENPGYQHFFLKPLVTNRIDWVSGTYRSIHGTIESRWEHKKGKHYQLTVHIPVNTSCTIKLQQAQEIEENNGITFVKHHDIYEASLDSGTYSCIFTIA
jgi:alpha-L-rhamnosidase